MTTDTTTTTTEPKEEDLDALFDELAQARVDGKHADALAEKFDAQPPKEGDDTDAAGSPAPAPAPPAAPTPAPAPASAAPAPAPTPPPAIDWSTLPPAVKEHFDKLENERRAAIGRAAAAQREAASLKQRVQSAAPSPAPAPAAAAEASAQLAKEFPELAAALKEEVSAIASLFDARLDKATTAVKAEALETVFPGWLDTMKSEQFHYWLSQQPEPVQKKFESDSLGDYASLLRDFHAAAAPAAAQPASEVARIKAEREALLANSTAIQTRPSAPNPTGEPDAEADPDGYFNWLVRKREAELKRAGRL